LLVSILIPVYNERTVAERSLRMVLDAPIPEGLERELIVVDDCSTDGTTEILRRLAAEDPRIKLFHHEKNKGKGASVRDAIQHATGDFCLVQDADLEYDAADYPKLLRPLLDGRADAVFGSRYLPAEQTRILPFWHSLMNKTLTFISNMFCNLALTDMETCYKVFRTDLLKSIPIRSDRFGFEPEITMKSAKRKLRIYEVPISYHGRTYEEGKKIGWRDGVKALGVILHFWLIDDLYVGQYGRGFLNNLTGTPQYVRWLTDLMRPHLGDYILEVGAGIGNISSRLMARRFRYMATENDALYLHALQNRFLRTPNVLVRQLNPESEGDWAQIPQPLDTVVFMNVLERAANDEMMLQFASRSLGPGGKVILIVPGAPGAMGSLDEALDHKRRYSRKDLEAKLAQAGFEIETLHQVNRAGLPAWLLYSRILRTKQISKLFLKFFDKTIWLWQFLDHVLPWPGVTVVCIGRKRT
jgi:glycosyltransferase involved in cell wall biosynthesis